MASGTPLAVALILALGAGCAADAVSTDPVAPAAASVTAEESSATTVTGDDGLAESGSPTPTSTRPSSTDTDEENPAVPEALDWSAELVGGGRIDLAERGDRPVLLWFWAPY